MLEFFEHSEASHTFNFIRSVIKLGLTLYVPRCIVDALMSDVLMFCLADRKE